MTTTSTKTSKMRRKYIEFLKAGYSPLECSRMAGYSQPEANYQKVYNHPDVQKVVAEMEQDKKNKRLYSKNDAINDLKEALRFARLKQDGLAMRHCIAELAKLLEFYKPEKEKPKDIPEVAQKRMKDLELTSEDDLISRLGEEDGKS